MKARSVLIRILGLCAIVVAGGFLFWPSLQAKQEEYRVRAVLLTVQESLQNYHVKEEIYPRNMMSGLELVQFLIEHNFLDPEVRNPWTGELYSVETDTDWLQYRTGALAETYELTVFYPNSEVVQFRLDSTENQSLE